MANQSEDRPATPRRNLSRDYETARSASPLAHPDPQTFCAERAKLLLGCYRRNDANDPDAYVQAITLVLSDYPRSVVEYVTDPRGGIQTQEKFRAFPPNAPEVKAACQDEMRRISASQRPVYKKPAGPFPPPPNYPGCWAKVFVAADNPYYVAAVAWANAADRDERAWRTGESRGRAGIWITLNGAEAIKGRRAVPSKSPDDAAFLAGMRTARELVEESDGM